MPVQILTGKPLQDKLLSGVKQLSDTVVITLGPRGRNVGIEKRWVDPIVVHDGVTVAKSIELPDPYENFAAQLVRQASAKTADKAGDGTTTTTLLTHKMVEKGFEEINEGANPIELKDGMEQARDRIIDYLTSISQEITTQEQITQIASIASASQELGEAIGEAMHKVGRDGVTSVEEYAGMDIKVEFKEGMSFDKGFISTQFANVKDKVEAELEAPLILITDQELTDHQALATFLKKFTEETKRAEIVIIASHIDGLALATLLINKERGGIRPLGIYAPGFANRRKDILEDIAVLTGGKVLYRDKNMKIEEATMDMLGKADSVWCNDSETKIVGGFGDSVAIENRAKQIRAEIEKTESDFEKEKLKERLARLVSGAAIIKVGARTEVELSDRKERVIDATEAVKAAMAEGIVAGGGIALMNISSMLIKYHCDTPDKEQGFKLVQNSLPEAFDKLIRNAGINKDSIPTIPMDGMTGINVVTKKVVNMIEEGIIDPTRVVKQTIENSVSVASMLLTTDGVVSNIREPQKPTVEQG